MNTQELGALIKKTRIEKHMSQGELADILHVSRTAVSKWETGINFPDLQNLVEISKILEFPLPELIGTIPPEEDQSDNLSTAGDEELNLRKPKIKISLVTVVGLILLIAITVPSILVYNNRSPIFTILDNFHGPYEDMECCCFIVTCQDKFSEKAWIDYTNTFREQYLACFNQVEAIVIAGFSDYDETIDTLDTAEYITVLYYYSIP